MERLRNTAIQVTTQEEWNTVIKILRPFDRYNSFDAYPEVCISSFNGSYCSLKWFVEHDYSIISFYDWMNGIDRIKPYLKAISDVKITFISVPKI